MKRIVLMSLVLAMLISLAGCACRHTPGNLTVSAVDTRALTMTLEQYCADCGELMETKESATGIAPEEGVMYLSAQNWFDCLSSNIGNYGLTQSLMPIEPEAQDDAQLFSVLNLSGLKTVMSFYDKDGAVITTERKAETSAIQSIHMQAQFSNDTASHFYMLLAMIALTNNSALTDEAASQIASQIMGGVAVEDNGYLYEMAITSVEDHTVMVVITAAE